MEKLMILQWKLKNKSDSTNFKNDELKGQEKLFFILILGYLGKMFSGETQKSVKSKEKHCWIF